MIILAFAVALVLLRIFYSVGEVYFERDWPRSTWRGLMLSVLLLILCADAFGQNVRFDLPITTVQAQGGNLLPVYAIPGAGVVFYNEPAGTLATTYISATSATTCPVSPTPAQVVLNGSSTCVSSADPYGNMGGWFQAGQYMATITAQGASYNYYFTVSGQGNSGEINITAAPYNAVSGGPAGANTTAIQAAATALVAGQCMYIPLGTYSINGTITINNVPNGCMHGRGEIVQTVATTKSWIIQNSPGFTVYDRWEHGVGTDYVNSGSPPATYLIEFINSSGAGVTHSFLDNFGTAGVFIDGTNSNIDIDDNWFNGPGSSVTGTGPIPAGGNGNFGIFANYVTTGGQGLKVTNNRFTNVGIGEFISNNWYGNVFTGNYCAPVGEGCIYGYPQDLQASGNVVLTSPLTEGIGFVLRHNSAVNTVGINIGPNVIEATECVFLTTIAPATSTFVNSRIHDNTCSGADYGILAANLTGNTAYDLQDVFVENNNIYGATTYNPTWGIAYEGASGKIKGNTINTIFWSCILAETSLSTETIEVDGNTTSKCGIQNSGGAEYQSNIYVTGPGKTIADNNKSYVGGGPALYSIATDLNNHGSIQYGFNNLADPTLPILNAPGFTVVPWPPVPFYQYTNFSTQQPENELTYNYAFNPNWVLSSSGGGSNPTVTPNGAAGPGSTGTGVVNLIAFTVGGAGGQSVVTQTVTAPAAPRTSTLGIWYKQSGSSCNFRIEDSAAGSTGINAVVLTTSATWQFMALPVTFTSGTSDTYVLFELGSDNAGANCSALIYGAQLTWYGGQYIQTAAAAINNTPYFPFAAGWCTGPLGSQLCETSLDGTGTVGVTETGGAITENTSGTAAKATALAATPGSATNQAMCWKAAGVPGYCSTVVGATGACTCN
jgi:hypothetical protein